MFGRSIIESDFTRMHKIKLFFILFFFVISSSTFGRNVEKTAENIFGVDTLEKFSYYNPMYVVGGDDDLKLQFSFKYRLAKSWNFYFAYTQLMFWNVYDESKPFADVNYNPEVFYRLFEGWGDSFMNLDVGYIHSSNGREGLDSRSLDRVFVRSSFGAKIERNYIAVQVMAYQIYNEDETNRDIVNHLGYYSLGFFVSDIILMENEHIDLEAKAFAGSKLYDFDKGGYLLGLSYDFESSDFNPSIYLQRFEGFGESLDRYNIKRTEYRIGLLLSF